METVLTVTPPIHRMLDHIRRLDLKSLPDLYNGASNWEPGGSGWCRSSLWPRWIYRPKNTAVFSELFRCFPVRAALEIGVRRGAGLNILRHWGGESLLLVGIDPAPQVGEGRHPMTHLVQKKSSEAFEEVRQILQRQGCAAFDLILIDGDHSYEEALVDLLTYSRLLSPGGVIYWDDARYNSVVRELKRVPRLRRHFELFGFGLEQDPVYDACWIGLKEGRIPDSVSVEALKPRGLERTWVRVLHKLSGKR